MDNGMLQYLRIYDHLRGERSGTEEVCVTVDRLAALLCCTPRNVKFVLRKLEEKGWIAWTPGKGRGNGSKLRFLREAGDILEMRADELLESGRLSEALDLIAGPEADEALKERLWSRFNVHLGLHSEPEESSVKDVLRMVRYRSLERLDPAFVYTAFEVYILGQVFDTLVDYDPISENFLPRLAHRWEVNEDCTRWTFYLRKGVRFHDGRPLTSRDVKGTLRRLRRIGAPSLKLFADIEEVETPGDHTVVFRLSRSNTFFLHLAGCLYLSVVPADLQEGETPVGSGPFRVAELNERKLSLSAFDGYFGYRPLLDRVDVWIMPDIEQDGRIFHLSEEDEVAGSRKIDYPAMGCRYLLFNFRIPGRHHDRNFRRAIRLLYDREAMVRELGGDRLAPASGFLPSRSDRAAIEPGTLGEARICLERSGYSGETLKLVFTDKKEEWIEANWLRRRAEAVGLRLELCPHERALGMPHTGFSEMALASEVLEDDWELDLLNYFMNEATYLNRLLDDDKLGKLQALFDGFMTRNREERHAIFSEAQDLLSENDWLLFGTHVNQRAYFNRNLYGLKMSSMGFPNLSRLWIKSEEAGKSIERPSAPTYA